MTNRQLFATPLYEARIDPPALLAELAHSIRSLAADDNAGRRWSRDHGYKGYTSYASLNDLPRRDPAFADLRRVIDRHAATFARDLAWDVRPRLDSLWVNLMKSGGHHAAHFHPHSILSGTFYVEVPPGSGAIRFEDPRAGLMMAAPVRSPDAPEPLRPHVDLEPFAGLLLLWESWLRHEVRAHSGKRGMGGKGTKAGGERLSISFNYA